MANNWVIKKPTRKDIPKIAEFMTFVLGSNKLFNHTKEFYNWKYFQNPAGNASVRIAVRNEDVIGIVAATYRKTKLNNNIILSAELGDLFTHPNYRRQGVFTNLCYEVIDEIEQKGVELIYVRPNQNSYLILVRKMGFRELFNLKAFLYPLDINKILRNRVKNNLLFSAISPIVRIISKAIFKDIDSQIESNFNIVKTLILDEDVYQLWQRVSKDFDIATVRDKEYLKWRYIKSPHNFTFYRAIKNKVSIGYVVVAEDNFKRGHIVDLLSDDREKGLTESLIIKALTHFRERGSYLAYTWVIKNTYPANNVFLTGLKKIGFRSFGKDLHFVVRTSLFDVQNPTYRLFFRLGDLDGI